MSNKHLKMIRTGDDPVLKTVCTAVEPGDDLNFLDTLETICRKCKRAVGLAAPQIGVTKRAIMLYCEDEKGTVRGRLLLNPEIAWRSAATSVAEEGCLSYPGTWKQIRRHVEVTVVYHDRHFKPRAERLKGFAARVLQHEIDHLDGICRVGDASYPADVPDAAAAAPTLTAEQAAATQQAAQQAERTAAFASPYGRYRRAPTVVAALAMAAMLTDGGRR